MPRRQQSPELFEEVEAVAAAPDAFALDDLKLAATQAAAENGPSEPQVVPLRGRGWFVAFQEAAIEAAEQAHERNANLGLPDGPYVEYCYMCESWTARSDNPMRTSIQRLMDLACNMRMEHVVKLISKYYRKHVQPRVGKHWGVHSIYEHITKHTLDPKIIVTENIRGLQCFIDAHQASAEKVTEHDTAAEGETDSIAQPPKRKRRRVDLKEADSYLKCIRTQASLIQMLQRLRNESSGGSGNGGNGSGGAKSM